MAENQGGSPEFGLPTGSRMGREAGAIHHFGQRVDSGPALASFVSQRLPVAKLHEVAVRIRQPTVVSDRVRFFTGRPLEAARPLGLLRDCVDCVSAVACETKMAKLATLWVAAWPTGQDHEDELLLSARLGKPHDPCLSLTSFIGHHESTEFSVEGYTRVQVAYVQRQMGKGRAVGCVHRLATPWFRLPEDP
jgi:hypothetical protein